MRRVVAACGARGGAGRAQHALAERDRVLGAVARRALGRALQRRQPRRARAYRRPSRCRSELTITLEDY